MTEDKNKPQMKELSSFCEAARNEINSSKKNKVSIVFYSSCINLD